MVEEFLTGELKGARRSIATYGRNSTTRPAADHARLDAFETNLGLSLPADLRAWWTLSDVAASHWIPGAFAPESLEEALETHEIWLMVAEQEGPVLDENGHTEQRYLPEFMPIALSPAGDGLIVACGPVTHTAPYSSGTTRPGSWTRRCGTR